MPTVRYHRFEKWMIDIIKEALEFLKSRIRLYGERRKETVDRFYHPLVDSEIDKEIDRIEGFDFFLDVQAKRFVFEMEESLFLKHMDVIKSALEIFLIETKKARAKSGVTGTEFDAKIQEIERALNTDAVKKGRPDLYDEYCEFVRSPKGVKVFLSYSHNDRTLAGKLSAFLEESQMDVFLAHEDIEISKEWRSEILKHLESCGVLLALLTPNFKGSAWANQEVGYVMRRMVPIVPVIVGEVDVKRFGFLEGIQGIHAKGQKLERYFERILGTIKTRIGVTY